MRTPTSLDDQLAAMREDRLRVLIAGAGVAGTTLAALLRREGLHPVLLERAAPEAEKGYMLGLMPLVEPVIHRLGVEAPYRDGSVGIHRYRLHGRTGATLRTYAFDTLLGEFGDYRGIARGALLNALTPDGLPVTFEATIQSIAQGEGRVDVTMSTADGAVVGDVDLVVAADGLHSATRGLVLRPDQVASFDTGWGGWVAWIADDDPALTDLYDEIWGAGFFVGIYPVKGRVGIFVGGDRRDTAVGPARFVARIRGELRELDKRSERALAAIAAGEDDYYWTFTDVRSATWSVGRVALLADAAAGFLPTAGIGAGMAMESAGALARLLATADRAAVTEALAEFARVQRPRVEAAQSNSRQLAHLVFQRNHALVAVRDLATRFMTLKMALGPIRKLLEEQPAA